MSSPKGFPSNQKVTIGETGRSNNYTTVIPTDPYRNALDTPRFAFRVGSNTVPRTAGANTGNPSSGPTFVEDTSTPAMIGDIFRAEDGDAQFIELPIVAIAPGGNGFYLSARLDAPPASGDEFYILRHVTQRTDDDGTQFVTVEPSPIAFIRNGTETVVTEDTVTPGNNTPLPVKLTGVTGDVNITAGDLNVQLSDQGPNADVTRIGDGTNQLHMTASNEAMASDADTHTRLDTLNGKDFATETTLSALAVVAGDIETNTAATVTELQNLVVKDFATEATLLNFSNKTAASLVPEAFDYQDISYVPSGDGVGEIQTVVYKSGGSGGTVVATVTLGYDNQNRLSSVTRT